MNNRRLLRDWPLAVFTLAIQAGSGIVLASTIAAMLRLPTRVAVQHQLEAAVFFLVVGGLAVSTMHLGRPLSAWRAFANLFHSKLSLEVFLTSAFAVTAGAFSLTSGDAGTPARVYISAITCACGLAAVCSGAAIYKIPARSSWNSGWVLSSFLGSTIVIAGASAFFCWDDMHLAVILTLAGGALVLISGAWMGLRLQLLETKDIRIWFYAHLGLAISALLLLGSYLSDRAMQGAVLPAALAAGLAIITGRMLMFALGEVESRF